MTFEGLAGLGLLGDLDVTGVNSDFTDIAGVVPVAATGNVITDPGPDGEVDIVSPQTEVFSVTVNGITTLVEADGTQIAGLHGTLTINLDGSYSYVPDATAAGIGQTDQFTYTLIDRSDGELESANLTITIGSDSVTAPPAATDDQANVTVQYQNVVQTVPPAVEFSYTTPTGIVILPGRGSGSDSFTVADNTTADITLTAIRTGLLSVLPSYTITVFDASGGVVRTVTQTSVAGLLLGTGVSITLQDLPAGDYTYSVSSTNVLGTPYNTTVYIGEAVTFLDQFQVTGATTAQGNLLDNDAPGTTFATLRVDNAGTFVEVGDAPVTIVGQYGTLTLTETGDYLYTTNPNLPYSTTDLIDSFTYQIVQPGGGTVTANLDVTIDIVGPPTVALSNAEFSNFYAEVPIDDIAASSDSDDAAPAVERPLLLSDVMFEEQGELEQVLGRYLSEQESGDGPSPMAETITPLLTVEISASVADPLDYLHVANELDRDQINGLSQI